MLSFISLVLFWVTANVRCCDRQGSEFSYRSEMGTNLVATPFQRLGELQQRIESRVPRDS